MRAAIHNSVPVMTAIIIGLAPLFAGHYSGLWFSIPIGLGIAYTAWKVWVKK